MVLGVAVCYAFGTIWFMVLTRHEPSPRAWAIA